MKITFSAASLFLVIVATIVWAVPFSRAAQSRFSQQTQGQRSSSSVERSANQRPGRGRTALVIPGTVRFREVPDRGLLVNTWINGAGSFGFAVDTGVGTTLISERVAARAHLALGRGATLHIGGLGGIAKANGREAVVDSIAIGGPENVLTSKVKVIVTNNLPAGLDGILEPSDAYAPLGFAIDMKRSEMSAFDPRSTPITSGDAPPEGTVVPWLSDGVSQRPFVMLDNGRRALIDTGSAFGFAISEQAARATGLLDTGSSDNASVKDVSGFSISSRHVSPATIRVGDLTLRRVPTDILVGVEADAPILLGRTALRPFHLAFDPLHRLILIAPSAG